MIFSEIIDFRQRRVIAHAQRGQNITPRAGNVYSVYGTKDEFENSSCEAFHHCAFS